MVETKWQWGLVVLLGLSSGFAGQWFASRMSSESPQVEVDGKKKKKRVSESAATSPELAERVEKLEAQLSSLRRSQQTAASLRRYAKALQEDAEPTPEEKNKMNPVIDAEDPGFSLAVRSVVDQVQWEKDEEQRVRRVKRRHDRAAAQTDMLVERLQLNDEQSETVAQLLAEQMEAFSQLRNPEGEEERPRTRSEWRERVTKIREETEAKIAKVLTPEELEGYKKFVEEEMRWGRRGGGSRSPGRGASTAERAGDTPP